MEARKIRILTFVDYYLPGYKAGGPIRTIVNMVSQLGSDFEILIVTRDRDFSDDEPYPDVLINQWNSIGRAKVFYSSPEAFSFFGVRRLLKETPHDVLYLNSFFSPLTTILPLIIRRIGLYDNKPVILAPRGEFSVGALALKMIKKKLFLTFARLAGIYRHVTWQASSEFEAKDILRTMFNIIDTPRIFIAPDLVSMPKQVLEETLYFKKQLRPTGPLRVIFLSRISPMKNLDYLLRVLGKVNSPVFLSIYGPIEDTIYWSRCQSLIQTLPSHINVSYQGEITHEQVAQTFFMHDVFIFPTRGENFGHVIYEALAVGTAVVVSDQTPWQQDSHGGVTVIALEQPDVWTEIIGQWADFNDSAYANRRTASISYATSYQLSNQALEQNRSLFLSVLDR